MFHREFYGILGEFIHSNSSSRAMWKTECGRSLSVQCSCFIFTLLDEFFLFVYDGVTVCDDMVSHFAAYYCGHRRRNYGCNRSTNQGIKARRAAYTLILPQRWSRLGLPERCDSLRKEQSNHIRWPR